MAILYSFIYLMVKRLLTLLSLLTETEIDKT